MPLQYAIEEVVPVAGYEENFTRYYNSNLIYHPTTKELAESDPENGYFSLANSKGERISRWSKINNELAKQARENAKSSAKPHKDVLGEELAVGDFVAYSELKNSELSIGQVLSFSKQKVRIFSFDTHWGDYTMQKNPRSLIKIQPGLV